MSAPPSVCPECGRPLGPAAPHPLCPGCLLAGALTPLPAAPGAAEQPPALLRLGGYELLELLGRGGMGQVWRARQLGAQREVALKVIASGLLATDAERRRFQAEVEAAARLDHANIVPVYEVGEAEGRPYFTMKLVPGGTLADRLRAGAPFPISHSAFSIPLLASVARAVHHAHQRGILHRDLKPANILLDADGQPLVADFGLARRLEGGGTLTVSGDVLGTPGYLAPEIAAGGSRRATVASDVYSLGAILYELLTGRPPFAADTPLATLRQVVEEPPRRPSGLNPRVDRDLETICLKCLEKEPAGRYPDAYALAEELERWTRGEPIRARPVTPVERTLRWAKRRPALAALLLLLAAAPAVIIGVQLERNAAVRAEAEETRLNLYAADMHLADRALREGNLGLARATLAAYLPEAATPAHGDFGARGRAERDSALAAQAQQATGPRKAPSPLRSAGALQSASDLRGFEWRWLWAQSRGDHLQSLTGFPRPPSAVAVSPDGTTLAIGGQDFLWRWRLDETNGVELLPPKEPRWLEPEEAVRLVGRVQGTPWPADQMLEMNPTPGSTATWINPELIGDVTGLSFSPDGRRVLSSTRAGVRAARVWNVADGRLEFAFPGFYSHAAFSPVANLVAVGTHAHLEPNWSGSVKLYDLEQRVEIWSLPEAGGLAVFSADGRRFVTGGWNDRWGKTWLHHWSLPDHRLLRSFHTRDFCTSLALSPDGRWIAAAHADSTAIELWSAADGTPARELHGHHGGIRALAFAPDGRTLASAGADQLIRRWSVPEGGALPPLRGHTDVITGLAFFPDGRRLVSASRDGSVRLWPTAPPAPENIRFSIGLGERVLASPDGRWWTGSHRNDPRLVVWNAASSFARQHQENQGTGVFNAGFDPVGSILLRCASGAAADGVKLEWRRPDTLGRVRSVELAGAGEWFGHAYAPAAELIALGQTNGWVRVWEARTGALRRTFGVPDPTEGQPTVQHPIDIVALSADGQLVAAGRPGSSQIAVFSIPADRLLHRLQVRPLFLVVDLRLDSGNLQWLEFSPDGRTLASTDAKEPGVRLWETRTGGALGRLAGHRDRTVQAVFAPDGRTLATTGGDGSAKLWHLPTRREAATLLEGGAKGPLAFSPDGTVLLVTLVDDTARIFRVPPLAEVDAEAAAATARATGSPPAR